MHMHTYAHIPKFSEPAVVFGSNKYIPSCCSQTRKIAKQSMEKHNPQNYVAIKQCITFEAKQCNLLLYAFI